MQKKMFSSKDTRLCYKFLLNSYQNTRTTAYKVLHVPLRTEAFKIKRRKRQGVGGREIKKQQQIGNNT